MKTEKKIASVGDKIIITNNNLWELSGALKEPYKVGSIWTVRKVIIDKYNPSGIVFVENNADSVPFEWYEVIVS